MGPIEQAMYTMMRAQVAFRNHGLLTDDECRVCARMIDGGYTHAPNCPVDALRLGVQRLTEFKLSL